MAARRSSSICLFCQTKQQLLPARRYVVVPKRHLQTTNTTPNDDAFLLGQSATTLRARAGDALSGGQSGLQNYQLEYEEEVQSRLLELDMLWKTKTSRQATLRKLSNPWPEWPTGKEPGSAPRLRRELAIQLAGPMPHAVFRQKMKTALQGYFSKTVRSLLRAQLLYCETARDVLRVVAVAMQHHTSASQLATLSEPLARAAYRCRAKSTDPEVLYMLNAIVWRFKLADLPIAPSLLYLGLKFSARARSLNGMKRNLRLIRNYDAPLTSHVFRSVVAKFSIGHRGLGEIRNGRWKRDELLQVLKGFQDESHLPLERRNHLETFIDRGDWQYLHGWVAALSRCKDSTSVWQEWQSWKQSDACLRPKALAKMGTGLNSRVRGEFWFIEQMAFARDPELAWKLFWETEIPFRFLRVRVQDKLLEGIEYAGHWNEDIRNAMLRKYDRDLNNIEAAFGVRWVPGSNDGEGFHELVEDQEEALDRLGADDWKLTPEYGYPVEAEGGPFATTADFVLQRAEERGLVQDSDGR